MPHEAGTVSGFTRHRKSGAAVTTFTAFEADLLRSLASQLVELLRNETAAPREGDDPLEQLLDFSGPTTEPEDPVLARLFPTAYPHDEEAAGEFRRFTEGKAVVSSGSREEMERDVTAMHEFGLWATLDKADT